MDENRQRQMDMDVEETSQDELEHAQIEERERSTHNVPVEGNAPRVEKRQDEKIAEQRVPADASSEGLEPLFEDEAARTFRSRWQVIQGKFVDDPRDSVKQADDLVADIIKSVTMSFADRRIGLEKQWNSGDNNISTEDMRLALKRYRSFFERLLTLES
ncbi:MAG TPA: hypothetical protein VIR02_04405 [Anaerolineales bacterium]